jgi:hypothetical protein
MAEPPVVLFGPFTPHLTTLSGQPGSPAADLPTPRGGPGTWWARLPSGRTLSAPRLGALVLDVEDAMAQESPGRPYTLQFDLRSHTAPPRLYAAPAAGPATVRPPRPPRAAPAARPARPASRRR